MNRSLASSAASPRVVLVGGGHTHALVLRLLGERPQAWSGAEVVVVSDVLLAPYSGMLPGYVAGIYTHEAIHIDLEILCRFARARLICQAVVGIDVEANRVLLANGDVLSFDYASVNIGSSPKTDAVPGVDRWAVPVKPVAAFLRRWDALMAAVSSGAMPKDVVIVGGGAGGVEVALAMEKRLSGGCRVHLVHRDRHVLSGHPARAQRLARALLEKRGIVLHLGEDVVNVNEDSVVCASGKSVPSSTTFWVTQVAPAPWVRESGVATDESGFIRVDNRLCSVSHPLLFAAGDVATVEGHPRPKAGVFAVRQAKPLFANIGAALRGDALRSYRPQKAFLSLISTATGSALASRRWLAWKSPLMWRWKDWIDRRFMRQFACSRELRDVSDS